MESDNKNPSKPSLFVDSITFNNGETIPLNHDDIVVFVGPNNAGKSQSLKDVFSLLQKNSFTKIVKSIQANIYNNEDVIKWLSTFSTLRQTPAEYQGLGFSIYASYISADRFKQPYWYYRDLFAVTLSTENRLAITKPARLINNQDALDHPIQFLKKDPSVRAASSDFVFRAFGTHITPGFDASETPLYVGDPIKLNGSYKDEQTRMEEYRNRLIKLPVLHEQGDGMRSLTGILLYLLIPNYSCFFIDEPESFLHPPQANALGEILIDAVPQNTQVFLATHSQEFLAGLISKSPNRVKIIRVTRDRDQNGIRLLNNSAITEIANDPFLYYSGIFNSLFHDSVVICESESDCRLYSLILNDIKKAQGKPNNTLFLHCGGKHRIAKIVKFLKLIGINFRVIVDIDILDNPNVIKTLYEECGGQIDSDFTSNYKRLVSGVESLKKNISWPELEDKIKWFQEKFKGKDLLNSKEIKEIRSITTTESPWAQIKRSGFTAIPGGQPSQAADSLNGLLMKAGIFIVPVGELEGFAKTIEGHGPSWVETLLERHPNLSDPIYTTVRDFIKELKI